MAGRGSGLLQTVWAGTLDLLFPPRCLVCDALAEPFCAECRGEVQPVGPDALLPPLLRDVRSAGYHAGPLRSAVLRLKFERKVALLDPLAELLAAELESHLPAWRADALLPVPIHWLRRLERGFNQSELLAEEVARRTGLPLSRALRRVRKTPHQVGLPRERRQENLVGAFAVSPGETVGGRRFVLLDDVRTTGATLTECARTLRAAGAEEVYGLTVTYDA
ncbi:MAG: ComF family protein [Armatimonadota bacterium]